MARDKCWFLIDRTTWNPIITMIHVTSKQLFACGILFGVWCSIHIKCKDISSAEFIRAMQKHSITVFPRNGFLLGVVRHGGYLPHERIDSDLGVLFSDISKIRALSLVRSESGKIYYVSVQENSWWRWYTQGWKADIWDGKHPTSGENLPMGIAWYGHATGTADFVYSVSPTEVFYPLWTGEHNYKGSIAECVRYNLDGAHNVVLENRYAAFHPRNGHLGTIFNMSDLNPSVDLPFYGGTIPVPSGYRSILTAFYGKTWNTQLKRSGNHGVGAPIVGTDIKPKSLCEVGTYQF